MPSNLEPLAEEARERHKKRHANPGIAIEVEKVTEYAYRLASPHSDTEAWQAMVCDALGTRSEATALTFLYQLTNLCQQDWHPDGEEGGGEWVPDECELNMILNMVSGIRPKNEMQVFALRYDAEVASSSPCPYDCGMDRRAATEHAGLLSTR